MYYLIDNEVLFVHINIISLSITAFHVF